MAYNPGMNYNPTGGMSPYSPYSYMGYQNGAPATYAPPVMPTMNNNAIQNQTPVNQPSVAIQGRMVTSREEALGVPVDFSGTPIVMPCMNQGYVFIKLFDTNTGGAKLLEYRLVNPQQQEQPQQIESTPVAQFVPLEDFQALQGTVSDLQKEIERLKKPASSSNNAKGVKKDEQ